MSSTISTPGAAKGYLRHVFVLMSWTAVAQVISVLSMLFLPRLFTPSQFGVFSVFSGVAVMMGIVASARYEFAIGLPATESEGGALFTLCALMAALFAGAFAVLFAFLPEHNWLHARFPELRPWWSYLGLGVVSIAWYNAASYLALRYGRFALVGKSKAAIALVTALGQVGGALLVTRSDGALILPFIMGQLAGTALIAVALRERRVWYFDRVQMVAVAKRYSKFPRFVATGSLLDGVTLLLPVAVFASTLSATEAGIYSLAERTLRMPVTLIGSSILQVFYKRLSDMREDRAACRRLLLITWRNLALAALGPSLLLLFFGEELFGFVFGAQWRESGSMARVLVISFFVLFVSYPTSNIFFVNERTRAYLVWQLVQLCVVAAALASAVHLHPGSLIHAVTWLVAGQACVQVFSMWLQWRAATAPQPGAAQSRG